MCLRRISFALLVPLWLVTSMAGAAFAPPPAGWQITQEGQVHVVHPPQAGRLAREVAARTPLLLARVENDLGIAPLERQVTVVLAPSPAHLAELRASRTVPRAPDWAAGYVPRGSTLVVLTPFAHQGPFIHGIWQILHHELVHVRMGQVLKDRGGEVPKWFWEGAASVLAHEGTTRDQFTLATTAIRSGAPDLRSLSHRWPQGGAAASAAYVTAYAFVAWLVKREGTQALGSTVSAVADGEPFDAAFERTYGATWQSLEEKWVGRYLWVYRWVPVLTSGTTLWLAVTLLFAFAGWRKKRRSRLLLQEWEEEEQLMDRLQGWEPRKEEGSEGNDGDWLH